MAILVTGGAGYIGSVMVHLLRELREDVVVLDDLVRGHRGALEKDIPFYRGSMLRFAILTRQVQRYCTVSITSRRLI